MKYTLTNAGHIAGIVNPVGGKKAWYRTKDRTAHGEGPDAWLASTERREGSWWEDWAAWAATRSGEQVRPYELPPGEPAPGRYVRGEDAP